LPAPPTGAKLSKKNCVRRVDLLVTRSSYRVERKFVRSAQSCLPTLKPEGDATMRFMTLVKSAETWRASPPPKELIEAIGKLGETATKAGVMVDMGGLAPSAAGARVTLSGGGKVAVNDGPFTEAKEVVGGYAIFNVESKQEAIEWSIRFMELHKQHWKGWEGEVEIRQLMDGPPDQC
jgi:hypothetical protein